jgi:outer membrane protein assembly factor BamB
MSRYIITICRVLLAALILTGVQAFAAYVTGEDVDVKQRKVVLKDEKQPFIKIINGTFLGNEKRNFYGDSVGDSLNLIWRVFLGKGTTVVSSANGEEEWAGAGWTGQPLLVYEGKRLMLLQGCFDHHLKKIDAQTGELIWQYAFDDVIKGTGTIWENTLAEDSLNRLVIMQGSRAGAGLHASEAFSFRAVSYFKGNEIWRMNVPQGPSYSRDCDASALVLGDTAYLGLENASFVKFLPGKTLTDSFANGIIAAPEVLQTLPLSSDRDAALHGGNLVTEASPVRIGNHIYIASGAGHVFGYNLQTQCIDWDFYIGADLDGTPVVTADSCLLVPVEKQYISGCGGVYKINPRRTPQQCIDWYFPTGDAVFSGWKGGVVGSVAVNDAYRNVGDPYLAAFTGIDGKLCVVEWNNIRTDTTVTGPDGTAQLPCPKLVFKTSVGASISTPLFTQNRLVAAGYNGIRLYAYHSTKFEFLDTFTGIFEATPVVHQGRVYVASRDGYLYCLGGSKTTHTENNTHVLAEAKPVQQTDPQLKAHIKTISKPAARKEVTAKETLQLKTVLPATQNSTAGSVCQLITGVFRSPANADRCIELWIQRGFRAQKELKTNGLYYIIIATGDELSLQTQLKAINTKYATNAWTIKSR